MAIYKNTPPIVTNGLVLHLDAGSRMSYVSGSTTWNDLSGNMYSGSLFNTPTFDSANQGALVFNGTTQYVSGSTSTNFAFGTGNFTVSCWFYITSGAPTIVDFRTNVTGNGPGYSDYITSNKFGLWWNNGTRYLSTGSINLGSWYNTIVTRQSTTVSVYINGILDGTSTDSTNLTENGFLLAKNVNNPGATYMNGKITQLMVYNRALSAQEVAQNYNALKSRFGLT